MSARGNPEPPVVPVRGRGLGGDTEASLYDLLVATFGYGLPGQALTTTGPDGVIYWASSGSFAAPAFTAFSISGQANPLEVGATIASGNATFNWATSNSANVVANSIGIVDTTNSVTLASGLANTGSDVISLPSPITNNSPASQVWTITGQNTAHASFSDALTVNWYWRVYAGSSSNATLTANQIKALSDSSALQASYPGTYSITNASVVYYYFCCPVSMLSAGQPGSFYDVIQQLNISMATASDNAAYSNAAGIFFYALVSVTNANSIATNYAVFRTQFNFSAQPLEMKVS